LREITEMSLKVNKIIPPNRLGKAQMIIHIIHLVENVRFKPYIFTIILLS
jgi:hypothetical protein